MHLHVIGLLSNKYKIMHVHSLCFCEIHPCVKTGNEMVMCPKGVNYWLTPITK